MATIQSQKPAWGTKVPVYKEERERGREGERRGNGGRGRGKKEERHIETEAERSRDGEINSEMEGMKPPLSLEVREAWVFLKLN